jgi:hypothetical protein
MLVTTYQPTTRIRRRFHPVHLIIYCLPSGTGLKPVALGLMNASHKIARLKNTTLSNASSAAGHPVLPNCLSATLSFLVGMVRPIFCWIPVALTQVITKSKAPRSSPISLSGKNPQNRPQIRNNLSLKSAIPDKAVTCHSCDPDKCVTYSQKKKAGPHTGLLLRHIQSIQYISAHKMYIRVLSLPQHCVLSPQHFVFNFSKDFNSH